MKQFRHQRSITWGKRLVFVVLILVAIGYGVLSMAERSKEPIRKGLEDYLEDVTGQDAEITEMKEVSLVPDVVFKMSGIILRDRDTMKETVLKADTVYFGAPLMSVFSGTNNYLGFEIKKLEMASGFFLPEKLTLDFAGISDPKASRLPPTFLIEGRYNGLDLLVTAEMDRRDRNGKAPLYRFKDTFPMTFKLGKLEGSGDFVRTLTTSGLQKIHLDYKGKQAELEITGTKAKGMIDTVPFNAELTKSGDSNMLRIIPETADPKALLSIRKFINDLQKDLGLNEKTSKVSIEILTKDSVAP